MKNQPPRDDSGRHVPKATSGQVKVLDEMHYSELAIAETFKMKRARKQDAKLTRLHLEREEVDEA